MYARYEAVKPRPAGTTGVALVVLLATTIVSVMVPRWIKPDGPKMVAAAASIAAGIVAMAWVLAREERYPRWSFYGAAFVSILAVFTSAWMSGPVWMKETWPTLIIYPSYLMVFMTSRRGRSPAKAAWVPIASALILGVATVIATGIIHRPS